MVSITHHLPVSGENTTRVWLDALSASLTPAGIEPIRLACEFAESLYGGKTTPLGTPLLQHALGTASILLGMHLDHDTVIAAILHAVPECMDDWQGVVTARFGHNITVLVEGISRMQLRHITVQSHVRQLKEMPPGKSGKDEAAQQIESLRKMLLAMVEDIRVVLIKLAERTQTLRNLSSADADTQQCVAQEAHSLFAPLANRLGVWQLKWELEDLSVRYLEPALYKKVARLLDERRLDRERYITDVIARLQQALAQAGIHAEVTGRPKHIYSIINKMKRKHIDFDQLYDVRAVRVLIGDAPRSFPLSNFPPQAGERTNERNNSQNLEQCYAALSIVHELWPPIAGEFDDYIANPKSNGYRSLHTAVIGPRELPLEVQIRTRQMHHDSELGVAAHWRYKENRKSDADFDEKISWLRRILEWKADLADSGDLREQFKNQLLQDRVYALTPQGKVIDLPRGATPVDFAYTLHTDLGHRTRGAKVDGSIVPLNYTLQNGQRVEILTTRQGAPSRDWLSPALGYLRSARARAKVRHWFKTQNPDDSIAQGRALFEREMQRMGVSAINQEKIAQRLRFNRPEDLLTALGRGEITPRRVGAAIRQELPAKPVMLVAPAAKPTTPRASSTGVLVEGVNNLMIRMAKCCKPEAPGDILGYITRDRGITIHSAHCAFMQRIPKDKEDRMLKAEWSGK